MKAPHPADEQAAHELSRAASFSASIFLGSGKYKTARDLQSLTEAVEAGRLLEELHGNGRKALVYVITPEGASIMIPRALYPQPDQSLMENEAMTTPTASGMNGTGSPASRQAALAAAAAVLPPIPEGIDRSNPAVKAKFDQAREKAKATPAPAPEKKETAVTKETLKQQVSAAPSSKMAKIKAAEDRKKAKPPRQMSPDALKPIVPLRGTAQEEFLAALAKADKGQLPSAPDFSAPTHKPYRDELKALVALAKAGDLTALRADKTLPTWTSRTLIVRYRTLAVRALEVQKKTKTTDIPGLDKVLATQSEEAPAKTVASPTKSQAKSKAPVRKKK